MLKVVFFARVKEQLDCARLELDWDESLSSLAAMERQLVATHGGKWEEVLGEDNLVRAINHTVVDVDAQLRDGDEVAFFPPVTGG